MSQVNHPKHYNLPGKKECIVEMYERFGALAVFIFCVLNTYKYRYRAGYKDSKEQDIDKAKWYIEHAKFVVERSKITRLVCRTFFPRILKYVKEINA